MRQPQAKPSLLQIDGCGVEDLTAAVAEFTALAEALERPKDGPAEQ